MDERRLNWSIGQALTSPGRSRVAIWGLRGGSMRRVVAGAACAGLAVLVSACGSSSGADQADKAPAAATTATAAAAVTGPFNAAEIVANGPASQWAALTLDQKLAVVQRYVVISGSTSSPEAVAVAAEGLAAVGRNTGSMRDFLARVSGDGASAGATTPAGPATTTASPPPPTVEANPDGTYTFRCDYVLGDFSDNTSTGFRLIAGATLKNTGNIGTVSRVTAIWDQLGTDPIKKTKTAKVAAGQTKRVNFTVPIDQNTLDLIQAADGECRVRSAIVSTFGTAR